MQQVFLSFFLSYLLLIQSHNGKLHQSPMIKDKVCTKQIKSTNFVFQVNLTNHNQNKYKAKCLQYTEVTAEVALNMYPPLDYTIFTLSPRT